MASLGAAFAALLSAAFLLHRLGAGPNNGAPCNCFGVFGGLTPVEGLQLNAAMLALCTAVYCQAKARIEPAPKGVRRQFAGVSAVNALAAAGGLTAARSASQAEPSMEAGPPRVEFGHPLEWPAQRDVTGRPFGVADAAGRCT